MPEGRPSGSAEKVSEESGGWRARGPDHEMARRAATAAAVLRRQWQYRPSVAIMLGSGLSDIAGSVAADGWMPYDQIPYFPLATAPGHDGRLRFGFCQGQPVVVLQGRWHLYEGMRPADLEVPIRTLAAWGVRWLLITSAAGGLSAGLRAGQLVVLRDHLSLLAARPWWPGQDPLGGHLPGLRREAYDARLAQAAVESARQCRVPLSLGTYAMLLGPNYETRAEYRMLRRLGVDLVGMSTVPEALIGAQIGLRILAVSVVTNICQEDRPAATSGSEVIEVASRSAPKLQKVLEALIGRFDALESDEERGG